LNLASPPPGVVDRSRPPHSIPLLRWLLHSLSPSTYSKEPCSLIKTVRRTSLPSFFPLSFEVGPVFWWEHTRFFPSCPVFSPRYVAHRTLPNDIYLSWEIDSSTAHPDLILHFVSSPFIGFRPLFFFCKASQPITIPEIMSWSSTTRLIGHSVPPLVFPLLIFETDGFSSYVGHKFCPQGSVLDFLLALAYTLLFLSDKRLLFPHSPFFPSVYYVF